MSKEKYGSDALAIFIMPPNVETLRGRLLKRGTESPDAIETRIARAAEEIGYSNRFDIILVNDDLHECLNKAEAIAGEFYNK